MIRHAARRSGWWNRSHNITHMLHSCSTRASTKHAKCIKVGGSHKEDALAILSRTDDHGLKPRHDGAKMG